MKNKQTFNKRALKRKKPSKNTKWIQANDSKMLCFVLYVLLDHFRRMSLDRLENCM